MSRIQQKAIATTKPQQTGRDGKIPPPPKGEYQGGKYHD